MPLIFIIVLLGAQTARDAQRKFAARTRQQSVGEHLHRPVIILHVSVPKYSNALENEVIQLDVKII